MAIERLLDAAHCQLGDGRDQWKEGVFATGGAGLFTVPFAALAELVPPLGALRVAIQSENASGLTRNHWDSEANGIELVSCPA